VSEGFITQRTLPFSTAHIWTYPLDVPGQIAKRCENLIALATSVTLYKKKKIFMKNQASNT